MRRPQDVHGEEEYDRHVQRREDLRGRDAMPEGRSITIQATGIGAQASVPEVGRSFGTRRMPRLVFAIRKAPP